MRRPIEQRLAQLEAQQNPKADGPTALVVYRNGVFVRAESSGQSYTGSLEACSVVSRVNFVSPVVGHQES